MSRKSLDRRTLIQPTLRVQMPPSFAVQVAVPILRDLRTASTEVDIDLISPYGGLVFGTAVLAVQYALSGQGVVK